MVFTEVDASLLTARASRDGGRALHDRCEREQIALVFCSSRTRAELEAVRQDFGLSHPFICENGAGVFVPDGYFPFEVPYARDIPGYHAVEFGRPYAEVVDILHRAAARLGIDVLGFSDMSVEQVAADCGLPLLRARLAKLREYGELFQILDAAPAAQSRLRKALQAAHLTCTLGTPYSYVGSPVDRDPGIGLLTALYRRARGGLLTIDLRPVRAADPDGWMEAVASAVRDVRQAKAGRVAAHPHDVNA